LIKTGLRKVVYISRVQEELLAFARLTWCLGGRVAEMSPVYPINPNYCCRDALFLALWCWLCIHWVSPGNGPKQLFVL